MSSVEIDLCYVILEDYFGYYVATVGKLLLTNSYSLRLIICNINSKLSVKEIKRSMIILEQHNLLEFQYKSRNIIYNINPNCVYRLIQVPRITLIVKTLFGNIGKTIFEEIVIFGKLACSECLHRVASRLNIDINKAKENFSNLIEAQMLIRCSMVKNEELGYPTFENLSDAFLMPKNLFNHKIFSETNKNNNLKKNTEENSDVNILWKINWPRVERFLRDELILDAISENELFDKISLQIARLLIKVGEVKSDINALQSQPISLQNVFKYSKDNNLQYSCDFISNKLAILAIETNDIIRKVGDSGGGLYIINYEKAIQILCNKHIESVIREKFDDQGVRIFRLLLTKGFLEEDQIEKFAMLSTKESKKICYLLIDSNFITIRQIAKTNDFAPARTFYLCGVSIPTILGTMINMTAKALRNEIKRRKEETFVYNDLLDRQLKIDTIIANIKKDSNLNENAKNEQIAEVKEVYLTVGDKQEIIKFKKGQQLLWSLEVELEKVLFLLQQYERCRRAVSIEQLKLRKRRRKPKSILNDFI